MRKKLFLIVLSLSILSFSVFALNNFKIKSASTNNFVLTKLIKKYKLPPSATISGSTSVCQNDAQPQITFTGSGGTAPYVFLYTLNGGGNQTISTTGANNSFVGYYAGFKNTSGYRNVFMGSQAGYHNTTATYNTMLGDRAGYYTTTGSRNTFVGKLSGYKNSSGYENTLMGGNAGYNNIATWARRTLPCPAPKSKESVDKECTVCANVNILWPKNARFVPTGKGGGGAGALSAS